MVALFQTVLMHVALCGLAASLLLLALRSRIVRDTFARLLSIWRSLTVFGRFTVCSFLLIGILIGGDKTNSVPPNMNSPLPQMQQGGVFLTGFTGLTGLSGTLPHTPSSLNPVNLVNPVQNNFAQRKAANWNIRGAWKDSLWLSFEDGWVFPWGTNHLSGVEVVSYGQVWATPFDTNAVASAGAPFEIVTGHTTFGYELTPSNSYRFVWTDAAVNRDTNNLVSATLELFRNGDVSVTTNGVAALLPRELPFPHSGFGQDAEWVAANFTNATEILAVGYPQWVDAQVGDGLTNGLYKFTATIPDDPPETVQLVVGDLSVAVTNAGEYIFLLEKGIDYEYGIIPFMTNVSYSAVDDVPQTRGVVRGGQRSSPGDATRTWTVDGGYGNEPQTEYALGRVWWLPFFFGSPDVSHIGPENDTLTFTANFADCRQPPVASYLWSASDGLTVQSPNAQTTQITIDSEPAGSGSFLSATWHARRLKSDGSYDEWQLAEYNHHGASVVFTPSLGGIYQVRALASVAAGGADERFYVWDVDENQMIGLKKHGDIKAFGVCDEQWQIDLRNQVLTYVGLPQYTKAGVVAAQYGFSEFGRRSWKCNVFVAHSAVRAGLAMPHNRHWLNVYPPVANDWANGTGIEGWSYLGRDVYLQPGYVAGHPATMGSGHCGVVDFDGWVVAAGEHRVNRRYKSWQDGTTGFHKYGVQVNQGE